jgi:hypothetical protein
MTSVNSSTDRMEPAVVGESWTARALCARHKRLALGVLVALAALLAITVGAILASHPLVVSDSTTCADWGSATYTQQRTYARRYIQEHRSLPSGSTSPAHVMLAINVGCTQAYANDVQDTATIVAAIRSAG